MNEHDIVIDELSDEDLARWEQDAYRDYLASLAEQPAAA